MWLVTTLIDCHFSCLQCHKVVVLNVIYTRIKLFEVSCNAVHCKWDFLLVVHLLSYGKKIFPHFGEGTCLKYASVPPKIAKPRI